MATCEHNRTGARSAEKVRALVVDDNLLVQETLRMLGEDLGWEVVTATDGISARVKFSPYRINIVMLDLQMPVEDGFTVLQSLREHCEKSSQEPPLWVAMSGAVDGQTRRKVRVAGFAEVLQKPPSVDDLTRLSDQVLGTFEERLDGGAETVRRHSPALPSPERIRESLLEHLQALNRLSRESELLEMAGVLHKIQSTAQVLQAGRLLELAQFGERASRAASETTAHWVTLVGEEIRNLLISNNL